MGLIIRHRRHGNVIAGMLLIGLNHLADTGLGRMMQNVRQQQRKGLIADQVAGTPDRMAKAQGGLLTREARLPGGGQLTPQRLQLRGLAALGQRLLQFVLAVEVILDGALVAAGDKYEMLNPGATRLVDHMLDERAIDDGEHLLRHGLGGRQEAGAETGDRKHSLANALWRIVHVLLSQWAAGYGSANSGRPL